MRLTLLVLLAAAMTFVACKKEQTTKEGYTYIHHKKNKGTMPKVGDYALYHIYVRAGDKVVATSREDGLPAAIRIPADSSAPKLPPMIVGLKMMSIGDSMTINVPIDTIKEKPNDFKDVKFVTYDLVLQDIKTEEQMNAYAQEEIKKLTDKAEGEIGNPAREIVKQYLAGTLGDKVKTTPSGLKYYIVKEGTGAQAAQGDYVTVHYYGLRNDGVRFDDSYSMARPFDFALGQGMVIPGWDEGIALLKEGTKAYFFVPYKLAYGEKGAGEAIPPKTDINFFVELKKVNKQK